MESIVLATVLVLAAFSAVVLSMVVIASEQ